MSTITFPRPDVTSEEVTEILRVGLPPRYKVQPGMFMTRVPFSRPRPGQPDTIVVGTGSSRLWRAQLTITRQSGETQIQISPGGLTLGPVLVNRLGIVRTIRQVLIDRVS